MKLLDILLLVLVLLFLWLSIFIFWEYSSREEIVYNPYTVNLSKYSISNQSQFYPNMRYRDRNISYWIESACGEEKEREIEESFSFLSENTVLRFYSSRQSTEIKILCSEIAPEPQEENHFVAGEGGPSEIINSSFYSIIISGKVSLYRSEKCAEPKIALHEILHSLGFDHNSNPNSIMYPVTDCNQNLDKYIIEDINRIYSEPPYADLIIEKVYANKTGRYLGFEISIGNYGLKESSNSSLSLYADSQLVKSFELGALNIGTRKVITVSNVRLPRSSSKIDFIVTTDENELSKENNRVSVTLVSE